jgi:hypothetical protein
VGDIGHGRQLRVIERVDPPIHVISGAMAHESAPDRVLDPRMPGDVRRNLFAQHMRGDAKTHIA